MSYFENIEVIERRLWGGADTLRANSNHESNDCFLPVIGLIFLRYVYSRFLTVKAEIEPNLPKRSGKTQSLTKENFSQRTTLFLQPEAQFDHIVALTDSDDRAQAIIEAMESIPEYKRYCAVASRVAELGDILYSERAPVGRINITTDKIIVGRGLSTILSKFNQQNWLFDALRNHFFIEDIMVVAIFAAITKADFYGVKPPEPKDRLIELFMEHVRPIDAQVAPLPRTTVRAGEARDLLLPRLMSGEVAV